MKPYGKEAAEQDLRNINQTVSTVFSSQVDRLHLETTTRLLHRPPGRQLLADLGNFWTNTREGFVLAQKTTDLDKNGINPRLMLAATGGLKFEDIDDDLIQLGLANLKSSIHTNPRMSTFGIAVATLGELSKKGPVTLASLDLPYEQTQAIPDARNFSYNWSRNLSPEHIWQSFHEIGQWSRIGLINPEPLSRSQAEKVVAASQFFGLAKHRLQQFLPSAA